MHQDRHAENASDRDVARLRGAASTPYGLIHTSTSWIHRRVDAIELRAEKDAFRRVSVDLTIPNTEDWGFGSDSGEVLVLLGEMPKRTSRQLSAIGPDAHALRVADSGATTKVAVAALMDVLLRRGSEVATSPYLRLREDELEALCREIATDRTQRSIDSIFGEFDVEPPTDPLAKDLVDALHKNFLFAVFVPRARVGEHVIIKYSVHWETGFDYWRLGGESSGRWWARCAQLVRLPLVAFGVQSLTVDIPLAVATVRPASYHLEVSPPEGFKSLGLDLRDDRPGRPVRTAAADDRRGYIAHAVQTYKPNSTTAYSIGRVKFRTAPSGLGSRYRVIAPLVAVALALYAATASASWAVATWPTVLTSILIASLLLTYIGRADAASTLVRGALGFVGFLLAIPLLVFAGVPSVGADHPWLPWFFVGMAVAVFALSMLGWSRDYFDGLREAKRSRFQTSVALVGDVCIDRNSRDGQEVDRETWGSAVLFSHQYLVRQPRVAVRILANRGEDFSPAFPDFDFFNDTATARKSLRFTNIANDGRPTEREVSNVGAWGTRWDNEILADTRALYDTDLLIVAPLVRSISAERLAEVLDAVEASDSSAADSPGTLPIRVLIGQGLYRSVVGDGDTGDGVIRAAKWDERDVLARFDVVVLSVEDMSAYQDLVREAKEICRARPGRPRRAVTVVITRRHRSVIWVSGERVRRTRVGRKVRRGQTSVGAGDTFAAALAFELANNGYRTAPTPMRMRRAIRVGARAAASLLRTGLPG